MVKRGHLDVPIIGVAKAGYTLVAGRQGLLPGTRPDGGPLASTFLQPRFGGHS
jgi:hypothetical protein